MKRTDVTEETYRVFVEAFRAFPGNVSNAARLAGTTRDMARRAWNVGWPTRGYRPVRELLDMQQAEARAARARAEDAARAARVLAEQETQNKAREDAVRALTQEGQNTSILRGNALALNAITANLLKAMTRSADRLQTRLDEMVMSTDTSPAAIKSLNVLVRLIAHMSRVSSRVTLEALAAERVRLGEPLKHAGMDAGAGQERTVSQIVEDIQSLLRELPPEGLPLPPGTASLVPDPGGEGAGSDVG